MYEISVFLLGIITILIPLLIGYLHRYGTKYIVKCESIQKNLEQTLEELNKLHNSALTKYASTENRITRLESENAARNYGKTLK